MNYSKAVETCLLLAFTLGQALGTPTFFFTQPDCADQGAYDPYNTGNGHQMQSYPVSYQEYQGPSYQESLQAMVDDTLRALREIVQVTVQMGKDELAALAKAFTQSVSKKNCNTSTDKKGVVEDHHNVHHDPHEHDSSLLQHETPYDVSQTSTTHSTTTESTLQDKFGNSENTSDHLPLHNELTEINQANSTNNKQQTSPLDTNTTVTNVNTMGNEGLNQTTLLNESASTNENSNISTESTVAISFPSNIDETNSTSTQQLYTSTTEGTTFYSTSRVPKL